MKNIHKKFVLHNTFLYHSSAYVIWKNCQTSYECIFKITNDVVTCTNIVLCTWTYNILWRKLATCQSYSHPYVMSTFLPLKCHFNFQTSELGSWEEQENAWDADEGDTDLTWEADNMIQEKRRQERQQRQQQHARRKQEKDQQRQGKQSSLAAVKLSWFITTWGNSPVWLLWNCRDLSQLGETVQPGCCETVVIYSQLWGGDGLRLVKVSWFVQTHWVGAGGGLRLTNSVLGRYGDFTDCDWMLILHCEDIGAARWHGHFCWDIWKCMTVGVIFEKWQNNFFKWPCMATST